MKYPTFFLDRTFGGLIVAEGLRKIGLDIQTHDQHFAQGTKDEEWIPWVGEHDWPVLTNDKKITSRPLALQVYKAAGIRLFVLKKKGYSTANDWIEIIKKNLNSMVILACYAPSPFLSAITQGQVAFRWLGDSLKDALPD